MTKKIKRRAVSPNQREANRKFWKAVVDRYENRPAGTTLQAFCRREQLRSSTLLQWRRKFREATLDPDQSISSVPASPRIGTESSRPGLTDWVPIHLITSRPEGEGSLPRLEILTPDGFTVRLPDSSLLGEAMIALRKVSC
jgi:transposase-like protein